MPFPHKKVLITGATSGIGRALAERMIENGIFVIAVGRRAERLDELVKAHGPDKIATDVFDVSDLDAIPAWAEKITRSHPTLSCIILNAGLQQTIDLTTITHPPTTSPSYAKAVAKATSETRTNYLSPVLTTTALLPHLQSLSAEGRQEAAILLVTSGLALVPLPRCPTYCASKAALHSFAWSLRAQLQAASSAVRVVEIMPPAVRTELHALQPELVAAGQAHFGMPLADFVDETWAGLERWDPDEVEIMPAQLRQDYGHLDDGKRVAFEQLQARIKAMARSA